MTKEKQNRGAHFVTCLILESSGLLFTIPQLNYALKVYVYTYVHWMAIDIHFSRSNATKKNGVTFRILKKKTDLNLTLITGQINHRKQVNYKSGPTTHFTRENS